MPVAKKTLNVLFFYFFVVCLFLLGTVIGDKAVAVISETTPIRRLHHIVIDAGHGGEDGGAVSCSGKSESNFNLKIALRLDDLLHLLGYDTIMIRNTDTAVYTHGETIAQKKVSDLKQRVAIIAKTPDAILVSIHQNSFPESQYHGAQVFYAQNENSELLAKELQESLIANVNPGSRRMAKQGSGIYLLDKITVPGVLVECGFISNPEEETKLQSADYQKKICCVLAASTARFLAST